MRERREEAGCDVKAVKLGEETPRELGRLEGKECPLGTHQPNLERFECGVPLWRLNEAQELLVLLKLSSYYHL